MKNRVISALVAALLALSVLILLLPMRNRVLAYGYDNPSGVGAEGDTPNGIHWTLYRDGTLYLEPGSSTGTYYLSQGDDVWAGSIEYSPEPEETTTVNGKELVKYLIVADRIGNIREYMFRMYPQLETVTFEGSITIEKYAFYYSVALTTVTALSSIESIGEYAFNHCDALTTVSVGGSVGAIGTGAFLNCGELISCEIDGTVGSVGNSAFNQDKKLTAFDAPVTGDIGTKAFYNCQALSSIAPIRGNVGESALQETALVSQNVFIVSGHDITVLANGIQSFAMICYTGTQEEYEQHVGYNCNPNFRTYQRIGDDVTWRLSNGVLVIEGSGSTIDLLTWPEQPWVNVPGAGSIYGQQSAITRVAVIGDITFGQYMLLGLEDRVVHTTAVHTVQFVDEDDTVLSEQTIIHGEGAVAPTPPEHENLAFVGWDVDFSNVTEDLTVTAQYVSARPGDTDLSGSLTAVDALLAMRHAMSIITLEGQALINGDVDGNGSVTAIDALYILRSAMAI